MKIKMFRLHLALATNTNGAVVAEELRKVASLIEPWTLLSEMREPRPIETESVGEIGGFQIEYTEVT